jgi:hypothetical protein
MIDAVRTITLEAVTTPLAGAHHEKPLADKTCAIHGTHDRISVRNCLRRR